MSTVPHSERALQAALEAMGVQNPTTAAITLFLAAARHLNAVSDNKRIIAELAYQVADDIVASGNE